MMMEAVKQKWITLTLLGIMLFVLVLILPDVHKTENPTPVQGVQGPNGQQGTPSTPHPMQDPSIQNEIPQPKPVPLSEHIVEYHIQVTLDEQQKTLIGQQTVTWKHPGSIPVNELYFHLYPNAFQSMSSTFNRESGGKLREDHMTEQSIGWMKLTSLYMADGKDLSNRTEYVQPDDHNPEDATLMRVHLFDQVHPGEKITLNMNFEVKLPEAYARMGYVGDFVMAGQWFPKLAVYERKGQRSVEKEGWNLHQYHGNSEFYADFGIYSVKIHVPETYTVAATGFPTKPAVQRNGVKTYQFYAEDVHDFAWAASPDFVYVEESYATENIPGLKIKLYLDPKHTQLKDRYLAAVKNSLDLYASWFGTYPYSTLSVVVPPEGGNGTGGMEYPTLITAWAAESENMPGHELERVVVHEIGHQYFYGMIASNEFEEAWLDEGFTSYAEDKVLEEAYGIPPLLALESSFITSPEPLKKNAWEYASHNVYAENVYTRAKLVLHEIERQIGEEKMRQVMQAYFQQYRFKHPSTEQFQSVLEKVTKQSWQPFFDQFIYGNQMVDYAVDAIEVRKIEYGGKTAYENHVVITSLDGESGETRIRFTFEDGTSMEKTWNGKMGKTEYKLISDTPLATVLLDPEHELILENKHMNNFMNASVDEKQKVRLNLGIVKMLETFMQWFVW